MSFCNGPDADDCQATRASYRRDYYRKQKLERIAKHPEEMGLDREFYALVRRRVETFRRDGKNIPRWMFANLIETEHLHPQVTDSWELYLPSQPRPIDVSGQRISLTSFNQYSPNKFETTEWEKSVVLVNPYLTDEDPELTYLKERLIDYTSD